MAGNREYKSDVFSMLLEEPANALEVYNGLNGTNYEDPNELEIHLLDKGVSLSIYNDSSFIIDMNLSLYEHQSTYNPNIPLRNLIYLVSLWQKFINNRDLYGRRLIKIPTPHFAVFYNGTEDRPEVEEMCLSSAFEHPTEYPEIELKCIVYNINKGKNVELLERCTVLKNYMYFVDMVRFYRIQLGNSQETLEQAIEMAIDDCIRNHILEEFFRKRRAEVVKVTQLDYTWERREELIRKEEYEEGRLEGKLEGRQEGITAVLKVIEQLKQGVEPNVIIAQGADEEIVRKALDLL